MASAACSEPGRICSLSYPCVKPVEIHANPVRVTMLSSYVVAVSNLYVLSARSARMATVVNANDVASSDHAERVFEQ